MIEQTILDEKAMLVNLSIGQWSMRKYDRKISEETNRRYEADSGVSRTNKILIAIDEAKIISKAVNEARIFHYDNTLPWSDEGRRILPVDNYYDYVRELGERKHNYWRVVESFWNKYDDLKEEARNILGQMFKEEDYPPLEVLRSKYKFSIEFLPVPSSGDFRVNLNHDELSKIKLKLESDLKNAETAAIKDLWDRLHSAIKHIIDRLSDKDAIFRDSLIGNVIELADLLPRLNFTNDPNLEAMRKEITQSICTITPDSIRNDAQLRKATADKADELLTKMEKFIQ